MRTLFCILTIFTLSATAAFSQLDLGIKLGYNSSLSLESNKNEYKDYSYKKLCTELSDSYHFGIFMRYSLSRLFFQPELLYLKQHDNYKFNFTNGDEAFAYLKYNMLELPVLIGFKILKSDRSSLNVYAGPRFSTSLDSSIKKKKNGEAEENYNSLIKSLDVGFALGASIDFRSFLLDVRYNIDHNLQETYFKDLPTSNFVISVGYKIF